MAYRAVVVGTDGSVTAERAVRAAAELAAHDGARLVVVAAYAPEPAPEPGPGGRTAGTSSGQDQRVQAEDATARGRELAVEAGAGGAVGRAEEGEAGDVLLDAARSVGADLIVVGSRGMTGDARFTIGSVAGTVSHHAPCDVLIVHTAG